MTTSQISNLIAARLVTKLTADLITAISGEATDPNSEKAGLVREGSLQDNPEKYRISILVHPFGDPDDENWKDIAVAYQEQQPERRQMWFPYGEIGGPYGGTAWYRRGSVEWQLFATKSKESRDEARAVAASVQGRVERGISQANYSDLTDDFGETVAFPMKPMWARTEEGGGPPKNFIWRGRVGYQTVSERAY